MTTWERWRPLGWLLLLGAVLLRSLIGAQVPVEVTVGLAALAALGLLARAGMAVAAAAGALVYVAVLPVGDARIQVALGFVAALGSVWLTTRASATHRALVARAGLIAFAAAGVVLLPNQAHRAAAACMAGGAAVLLVKALLDERRGAAWQRGAALLVAVSLAAAAGEGTPPFTGEPPEPNAAIPAGLLASLDKLRVGGAADAAHALIAVELSEGADPQRVSQVCKGLGTRNVLGPRWNESVARGAAVCRGQTNTFPHLSADAAFARGDIEAALQHSKTGGARARRYAVRALLDRNLGARAAAVAHPADPLTAVWLGTLDSWQPLINAWDPSRVEPIRRAGVRRVGAPGELVVGYAPNIGRFVQTNTRYDYAFEISFPVPRGARPPRALSLHARSRGALAVRIVNSAGHTVEYRCDQRARPLDPAMCRGEWRTVELAVPPQHSITELVLVGDFAIAGLGVVP